MKTQKDIVICCHDCRYSRSWWETDGEGIFCRLTGENVSKHRHDISANCKLGDSTEEEIKNNKEFSRLIGEDNDRVAEQSRKIWEENYGRRAE